MERFALRKIVSSVCDDYIDTLLTGIEENGTKPIFGGNKISTKRVKARFCP